eukprot:jgi/Tetstr1/425796/TSEL_001579.t1
MAATNSCEHIEVREDAKNPDGPQVLHDAVSGEDNKMVGLAAVSRLRPLRGSTESKRRGVNTARMEDGEHEAKQRRLPQGFTTPSMEMTWQLHIRKEFAAKTRRTRTVFKIGDIARVRCLMCPYKDHPHPTPESATNSAHDVNENL